MNKVELIKEIKRIQKEEQDYQALFKLMLKKSGKDIRSMGDDDKKKFFNAVDKAYKAKNEGKLIGYNDSVELNENWIPIALFVAVFLFEGIKQAIRFIKSTNKEIKRLEVTPDEFKSVLNNISKKSINRISNTITINDTPKTIAKKITEDPNTVNYINLILKNKKLDNPSEHINDVKDVLQKTLESGLTSAEVKSNLEKKLK